MTSPYKVALLRTGLALALALPPATVRAREPGLGVGWSNQPRWRLPRTRAPDCPRGYAGARALVQVRNARCVETGPQDHIQPPAPTPPARTPPAASRPEPIARPAEPERPAREPTPAPRPPRPALGPSPDATALMAMGPAACHDHLRGRDVPFVALPADEAPEVAIPVRLTGPVAGVRFTIPWSSDERRDHHAIWDCRLVAALTPLAEWLFARGVVEVQYFSALRRGKLMQQRPRSQHNIGLALDLYALRLAGGDPAPVEEAFPRRVLRGCPHEAQGEGLGDLYLGLVCAAHERGLVHTLLTPDYDREHRNHLHLDLKTGQSGAQSPYTSFYGL